MCHPLIRSSRAAAGCLIAVLLLVFQVVVPAPAHSADVPAAAAATQGRAASARSAAAQRIDVRHIIPPFNPALDAVHAPGGFGTGKIWKVGPQEPDKTLGAIARRLQDGDIVEIAAGTYKCDQSIIWTARDITIVGVGGKAVFDATGCGISGDKGIFNPRGANYILDNLAFVGAAGSSGNDAGIRADIGGYVYITNCLFQNNQDGVLFTPADGPDTNLVIDRSEFAHNGSGTGQTHNIYINRIHSFVLRFSYSHDAVIGHEVKSRADRNYILYNRIADEADGTASYDIDLPQGGLSYIIGNVIQKSPHADNPSSIAYSEETRAPRNPIQKLYVINNTIVNLHRAAGYRRAVWLVDRGLEAVQIRNNIIAGVPQRQLVMGYSGDKLQLGNNVLTDSGFYDATHRIYKLVAGSPAINAAADPGRADGFSLTPQFEFVFPHDGRPRPRVGALDAGAYEYVPGEVITPAPEVHFTVEHSPVDFNRSAVLRWSSSNATACRAGGGWSGAIPTSGRFTTPPLSTSTRFTLSCTGPSGTVEAEPVTVTVNDSAQANALGTYTWKEIPHSALISECPNDASYPAIHGAFGCSWATEGSVPVYVPDTQTIYFMGGSASYGYYGNEVFAFNLRTLQPERITDPTRPSDTEEFTAAPNAYSPPYTLAPCSRALHLKNGGIAMAVSGLLGGASWDPKIRKIVIGPSGYQRQSKCYGFLHDQWTFDPFTRQWAQVAPPEQQFTSTSFGTTWFLDPATGIAYTSPNGHFGTFLIDYNTTPPKVALVNNVYPFSAVGPTAIDTQHHYALQVVSSRSLYLYDLNGLSLARYGTDGKGGTTGHVGSRQPRFVPENITKITGDTALIASQPSLIYNPQLDMFVAWAGGDKFYFIRVDYRTKSATIISKHIPGGPEGRGAMVYIPSRDVYVIYTGMKQNFWLLLPPRSHSG